MRLRFARALALSPGLTAATQAVAAAALAAPLTLALLIASAPARAVTMNASMLLGGSILSGSATQATSSSVPMLGANLTVDVGTYVEAGLFYEQDFLSYTDSSSGSLRFYGALLRVGLLGNGSNLYADTEIGITQRTGGPFTSDHGLGLGVGVGYRIWLLPYLDLSPRIGVRILPEPFQGTDFSSNTVDGGLLLTFEF
jgi:hypothetical protein